MNRLEFEALWSLSGKCVNDDIEFVRLRGYTHVFGFDGVQILNELCDSLYIGGHYNCLTGAVVYNVLLKGIGSICRYCVGGGIHGNAGRFHFHRVDKELDVRRQLPYVIRRDDLKGLTARQVWEKLCSEANVVHTGIFFDPELRCP